LTRKDLKKQKLKKSVKNSIFGKVKWGRGGHLYYHFSQTVYVIFWNFIQSETVRNCGWSKAHWVINFYNENYTKLAKKRKITIKCLWSSKCRETLISTNSEWWKSPKTWWWGSFLILIQFLAKEIVTIFYRFCAFFIIISIIYKLWIGPTWSIIQTNSNHLNFEPCAKITKILGKLCSRKVSKSKQALFDENNFMHSIIDETYKYLFSLFGQGLAFPSKQ